MNAETPQSPSSSSDPVAVPTRTWLIWLAVFAGIILLMLFKDRMSPSGEVLSQPQFERLLDSDAIEQAIVNYNPQSPLNTIVGRYYRTNAPGSSIEVPFSAKVRLTAPLENKIFSHPQFEPREGNSLLVSVLVNVLPFIVIAALIWFFFIRQIKKAGLKTNLQHERLDRILSKWEAVLDKWEKAQGGRP